MYYNQTASGFQCGFSLHFDGSKYPHSSKNVLFAYQNPKVIDDKIKKEIELGRVAGPLASPPFKKFCVSPLGVDPKKTPGEYRLIHHLSFPKGSSVQYATICDAIQKIKMAGKLSHLAKTDVKNAFRIIPVSP